MANYINIDRSGTIKVVGKDGFISGVAFVVPQVKAQISQNWSDGEARIGHFHLVSLQFGLNFPLSAFVIEVLNNYRIALS